MYLISQKFKDIFPEDITEFSPNREVDLSIDLVPGAAPTSK